MPDLPKLAEDVQNVIAAIDEISVMRNQLAELDAELAREFPQALGAREMLETSRTTLENSLARIAILDRALLDDLKAAGP